MQIGVGIKSIYRHTGKAWFCLLLALLCSVSIGASEVKKGQFTVVLDAGHGGKDPGAVGNGAKEKAITLGIVKRLGQYIKNDHPEVRILYTRDKDVFVGLQARADFANRHKASLFISVHVNSAGKGSSARGTETYVLGVSKHRNNLSVAMRENKAMLLEDDYQTKYRGFDPTSIESYIIFDLMQEAYLQRSIEMANFVEKQYKRIGRSSRGVRQDGFWVLSQSAMPSILTEVGFITHSAEAAYLASDSGQSEMAKALAQAFTAFYKGDSQGREQSSSKEETTAPYEGESQTEQSSKAEAKPAKARQSGRSLYRIQIMSSPQKIDTKDKAFARLGKQKVRRSKEGRYYIYTVGESKSLSDIKTLHNKVRKYYKDSFIVEYQGSQRIRRIK